MSSRKVMMPRVSTAAATSPHVTTTDSRRMASVLPRPGRTSPLMGLVDSGLAISELRDEI
jgi:hypothetical protein